MPHVFTHAGYVDMVFVYVFCNGNAFTACREYSLRFPNRSVSDSRVFAGVYIKLRETGALPSSNISSERANEQNVDEMESILQSVEHSPSTSTRRISTRIGVPYTRVWQTLRQHDLYPFHLQMVQRLEKGNEARRLDLCRWITANRRLKL